MSGGISPSTAPREASRDAVVLAAMRVLQDVGYNRLRISDVVKRSGLSEGTLFHHFPTKYLLVAAAIERTLAEWLDRSTKALASVPPPHDARLLLRFLWNILSDNTIAWTYELFGSVHSDPELREHVQPAILQNAQLAEDFGRYAVGQLPSIPPEYVTKTLSLAILAMQGLVLRNMSRGYEPDEDQLIEYLLKLLDSSFPLDGGRVA